jgi:hypothetical protein
MFSRLLKRKQEKQEPRRHKFERYGALLSGEGYGYRSLMCADCGKRFVMDVLGGWAIEYPLEVDGQGRISNLKEAAEKFNKTPSNEWFNWSVDWAKQTYCTGQKEAPNAE